MAQKISAMRLVLGDQLSRNLASLIDCDMQNDLIIMAEVLAEASYVPHHKKKFAFVFAAMPSALRETLA